MDLNLYESQLAVLNWIANGADLEDPPSPTFKTSAVALRSRGLIELDKRRGLWSAKLAEKGRFYLAHGRHPDTSDPVTPREMLDKATAVDPEKPKKPPTEPTSALVPKPVAHRAPKSASLTIPSQIRNPHAAIRELLDHKSRVDVPAEERRRAHLILHTLVQEAVRRGWTVRPVLSKMQADPWTGTRTRVWPSADLFTIDAGVAPTAIRLRMRQRKVDHVPSKEDIAHEERYGYRRHAKHDFVPTDKMRLDVGAGGVARRDRRELR